MAIATTNLAESLDVSQRVHALPIASAMETLEPLLDGPLTAVAPREEIESLALPGQG